MESVSLLATGLGDAGSDGGFAPGKEGGDAGGCEDELLPPVGSPCCCVFEPPDGLPSSTVSVIPGNCCDSGTNGIG